MRKRDMTFASAVLEAIDAILALAYIGLQIYYGVCYPEKLNHIAAELCVGNIRKYSLRLLTFVKLVFTAGLLVPCVCDAFGIAIRDVYSLIMIGLILVVTAYYEYRIFQEIKSLRK